MFRGAGTSLAGSEKGLLAEISISHGECRLERLNGKCSWQLPYTNSGGLNTGRKS